MKTVLIVDDNRDAADTLAVLVRIAGHKPTVAYDTQTGFSLAHSVRPDIIIHDIGMPLINGYEAARILRSDKKFANTILIALTAYDATDDRKRARFAGFDFHASKPIDFAELQELLRASRGPN